MADYWQQNLLQASLDGVEFPVAERQVMTGRHFARYQYAFRDGQGVEDLGRKTYEFNLTIPLFRGVNVGHYPDTFNRLVAIVEDVELRGEVEYVDPEYGPFDVKIVDYSWSTDPARRDGGMLTLKLEERGFDQSLLQNLTSSSLSGRSRADALARTVDFELGTLPDVTQEDLAVAFDTTDSGRPFSLTQLWSDFQGALDQGALAADEIAAQLDELTFFAEKVLNFSAIDELKRWSIYNSTIDFLGAAQDVADETAKQSPTLRVLEVVLPGDMSPYDIAQSYLGDAGRATEVMFANPSTNPLLYARGTLIRLPSA